MADLSQSDALSTPEQRREIWMMICGLIVEDDAPPSERPEGWQDGARQALEYALMDDPPREWGEGTYGWKMLHA